MNCRSVLRVGEHGGVRGEELGDSRRSTGRGTGGIDDNGGGVGGGIGLASSVLLLSAAMICIAVLCATKLSAVLALSSATDGMTESRSTTACSFSASSSVLDDIASAPVNPSASASLQLAATMFVDILCAAVLDVL
jgi:hypothetical protein